MNRIQLSLFMLAGVIAGAHIAASGGVGQEMKSVSPRILDSGPCMQTGNPPALEIDLESGIRVFDLVIGPHSNTIIMSQVVGERQGAVVEIDSKDGRTIRHIALRREEPFTARLYTGTNTDWLYIVWVDEGRSTIKAPIDRINLISGGPSQRIPWPPPGAAHEGPFEAFLAAGDGQGFWVGTVAADAANLAAGSCDFFAWSPSLGWRYCATAGPSSGYYDLVRLFDDKPFNALLRFEGA